jgi:hypothetical protein
MKLVREHINEKFSEEGDPVYDMGIGPEGMLEDIEKKQKKEGDRQGIKFYLLNVEEDVEKAVLLLNYLFKKGNKVEEYDFNTIFVNMQLDRTLIPKYREHILPVLIEYTVLQKNKAVLNIALFECAKKNFTEEVIKLAKGGADPTMRSNKPIALAIRHRNKEMFDGLASYIKWKKPKK